MQPIIIIGTQRSGSNLLRLMLNQHKDIIAPHPPHILQMFFPLLERYGDLGEKKNFLLLVRNVCEFVNLNPVPWNLQLDVSVIAAKCRSQSLISIYAAIYETLAARKNAQLWCCKSMVNLYYIPQIEQEGLKPIYIHLVRDGRAITC